MWFRAADIARRLRRLCVSFRLCAALRRAVNISHCETFTARILACFSALNGQGVQAGPPRARKLPAPMNPTSDTGAAELLANLSVGTIVLIALALTVLRILLLSIKSAPTRRDAPPEVLPSARSAAEILESLIIAGVLVFLIIRPFFVQAFYIPSESMEPTLMGHDAGANLNDQRTHNDTIHDHIFVDKLRYRFSEPQHGDIIVFKAPKSADSEDLYNGRPQKENVLIKRLIGLPGDTIYVHDKTVFRNGKPLDECCFDPQHPTPKHYIKEPIADPQPTQAMYATSQALKLGPGQLFVMGDNRNDSNDARFWGPLDRDRVMGKAVFVFWPPSRIRVLH